jgi:nicotinate-nucleotide--dimethylbenzimidazole phosphoribosyltransferase
MDRPGNGTGCQHRVRPDDIVGLGAGADTIILDRKRGLVASAVKRAWDNNPHLNQEPLTALAKLGGPEITVLAGAVLGAADANAAVMLDRLAVSVAALVAVRLEPAVQANLIAGQRSRERGHGLILEQLGLEPLLDLRMWAGKVQGQRTLPGC